MQIVNRLKTSLLVSLLFILCLNLSAFATDPPDSVVKTFMEKFPQAEGTKWVHTDEKPREYFAEFTLGNTKLKAFFDGKGNLIETEKEIDAAKLPAAVKQALETQFQHFKILKSYVIEKSETNQSYELTIKSDGVKTTLVMSKDGYMIAR